MIRARHGPILDFHTHILPHMDDGAATPTESVGLLRTEYEQGVVYACLTPHFYSSDESASSFLERREEAYETLYKRVLKEKGGFPECLLGAEVAFYTGLSDESSLSKLTLSGSSLLLVEPQQSSFDGRMLDELSEIRSGGLVPVIAHLDRYIRRSGDFSLISLVRERGFCVQINCSFFLDPEWQDLAIQMLCCGEIDFIGSDTHNRLLRVPTFDKLWSVLRKRRVDALFTSLNSRAIQSVLQGYE